jgi:hypothetical protein
MKHCTDFTEQDFNILELCTELYELDNEHAQYIAYDLDMHLIHDQPLQLAHLLDIIKTYIEFVSPSLSLDIDIELACLFNKIMKGV